MSDKTASYWDDNGRFDWSMAGDYQMGADFVDSSEFPGLERLINASPAGFVSLGENKSDMDTDKRTTHQHGYREIRPYMLATGDWVYHTPRDKQVVSVEVAGKSPNKTVTVIWRDLTRSVYTTDDIVLASPFVQHPHLSLAGGVTSADRRGVFVDFVMLPIITAAREIWIKQMQYNGPPLDMIQRVGGVVSTPIKIEFANVDWQRAIPAIARVKPWGGIIKAAARLMDGWRWNRENASGLIEHNVSDHVRTYGMEIINHIDLATADMVGKGQPQPTTTRKGVTVNPDVMTRIRVNQDSVDALRLGLEQALKSLGDKHGR